jgi:arylsulfatase A-like enzyme
MDRLAGEGVAFTRAYCQSPICTPGRSSFLTGMYPSRLHNTRNGNETFPSFPPLITKLIADSGYECGLIGKLHLQSSGRRTEPRTDDATPISSSATRRGTTGPRVTTTPNG